MSSIVPYDFSSETIPVEATAPLAEGQYQVVHFVLPVDRLQWFLQKIDVWFEDRDEVIMVASGVSMEGEGFVVMEWEECEVDSLFLKILEHEEAITDVCVYVQEEIE